MIGWSGGTPMIPRNPQYWNLKKQQHHPARTRDFDRWAPWAESEREWGTNKLNKLVISRLFNIIQASSLGSDTMTYVLAAAQFCHSGHVSDCTWLYTEVNRHRPWTNGGVLVHCWRWRNQVPSQMLRVKSSWTPHGLVLQPVFLDVFWAKIPNRSSSPPSIRSIRIFPAWSKSRERIRSTSCAAKKSNFKPPMVC